MNKAALSVLAAALILGTSGLFIRAVDLSPFHLSLIRTAVPALFFLILFLIRRKPLFSALSRPLLIGGLLNAVRMLFYFLSYRYTSVGNIVVIFYTWPLFAYLFSRLLFREKISSRQAVLLAASFTGVLIIYSGSSPTFTGSDLPGLLSATTAALIYALSILSFKKAGAHCDAFQITFFQNAVPALIFLPTLFFITPPPSLPDTAIITGYGITAGIIAFSLFFLGLQKLPAARAAHLSYMEVPSAILLAAFFLGEIPGPRLIIGAILITGSLAGISREK